ncbi:MAG: hypothetical protein ACREGL_04295 [Alphaproteobacteria bacterium]
MHALAEQTLDDDMTPSWRDDPMTAKPISFANFDNLHPDDNKLILDWYCRAHQQRGCEPRASFEPFIYLWIAFNAWASCVTECDKDQKIIDKIASDSPLSKRFSSKLAESDFSQAAGKFANLWPIFRVMDIRWLPEVDQQKVRCFQSNRSELIRFLSSKNGIQRRPENYERGKSPTWDQSIRVIYQVRCNLFHGDKARNSESDSEIVDAAFKVLIRFWDPQQIASNS